MDEQQMLAILMQQVYGKAEKWDGVVRGDDASKWQHTDQIQLATLGAGCFWGTEKYIARDFAKEHPGSILGTSVGFMSPDPNGVENPSYEDVCEGTTGHVEVLHVLMDTSKGSYEDLIKFFFTFHDPTTRAR